MINPCKAILIAICTLLFIPRIHAQTIYSGKVSYNITINDVANDVDVTTNGAEILLHMKLQNGREVDIKSDRYGKKQVMILHNQKSFINLTVSTVEKLTSMMKRVGKVVEAPIISETRKTGESKKINGYICEKLIQEDGSGTVEIWATNTLGSLAFSGVPFIPLPTLMNSDAAAYFPLEIISKNTDGSEVFIMKTNDIKPGAVDESVFAIPTGYELSELPTQPNAK
jgi:hypothetical protein